MMDDVLSIEYTPLKGFHISSHDCKVNSRRETYLAICTCMSRRSIWPPLICDALVGGYILGELHGALVRLNDPLSFQALS